MSATVTALEVQKKNKERVNVYLDGEFAFGLTLIDAARLRKGQILSDDEIAALKHADEIAQGYERAVQFLSYRPRSIAEIRRNLAEKEIDEAVIDQVIARLENQGYVDDLAFARFWLNNRQEFRPQGARALRFELREKGVASSVIDEALAEFDTSEAAYRAAKDRARRLRGLDKRTFRNKLGMFLTRRGFDYDVTRTVIDRLIDEFEADDTGFFIGSTEQETHDTD